jgi:DNA-binding NtrC family response regulator
MEDGVALPLGAGRDAPAARLDVKLVLATNVPVADAVTQGRLAHDLVPRLHRVTLPPLRDRRADVPEIFERIATACLDSDTAAALIERFDVHAAERLCLAEHTTGNVRELVDLATLAGARVMEGEPAELALHGSLDALLAGTSPVTNGAASETRAEPFVRSLYERHRAEIVAAYRAAEGNISALERTLRARGLPCNRKWLARFLARWGVRVGSSR